MRGQVRSFRPQNLWPPRQPCYDEVLRKSAEYTAVELEIGAGAGLHPIQRAQECPETLILAVERTKEKFESFQERLKSCDLPNLVSVHADVVPWLWHLDHDICFSKVWILYPNPEPQNKNQRWINSPFFHHLLERLMPAGEIEMATNIEKYADEVKEKALPVWGLECDLGVYWGPARTHFERKYQDRGETCYQLRLRVPGL